MSKEFNNDINQYADYNEYLRAWRDHMMNKYDLPRASTKDLASMSRDDLLDLVDKLYEANNTLAIGLNSVVERYIEMKNSYRSTHSTYTGISNVSDYNDDSVWNWICPWKI